MFKNKQMMEILMKFIYSLIERIMDKHWQSVRKNQINHSSSKQTFGFSKEQRFRSNSKPLCDNFYNLPTCLGGSRASGMGKGNKMNLVKNNKVPAPGYYHVSSDLKINKGVKFPLGRENIKYGGINTESFTPEPGRYSISACGGKVSKSHSLHKKLKPVQPSFKLNPGPGHYNVLSFISSSGKYPLSHISNCSVLKIKSTKDYDEEKYKKTPGPGTYNHEKQDISGYGHYFNSKYQGSRCRTFSKMSRKNLSSSQKKKEPGPGSYNFFSEFGCR